ncbi:hypothetical protein [Streptomyces sp. DSM 118878]
MRTPDADAENGRGLPIVTLLCERWDSYRHPSGGKVVYAVMPLARPAVAITREMAGGTGGVVEPAPRAVLDAPDAPDAQDDLPFSLGNDHPGR